MTPGVRVELGARSYDVLIGAGVLNRVAPFLAAADPPPMRALLVRDAGVPEAHARALADGLHAAGCAVARSDVHPSERVKTLVTAERLLADAAQAGLDRHDAVVALGGGIVGDLAGFVGATYRRGVRVVQAPTTLLAMVDASVGGKTGVNLALEGGRLLKNFVGAFHQPALVVADVTTLASLGPRVLRCGLAECIKHAMIAGDRSLLDWTGASLGAALAGDPDVLTELVRRNVAVKARFVAGDERETAADAGRALLNLGHTFAHAIETIHTLSPDPSDPALAPLMHGEAVALGLVGATALAVELGRMSPDERRSALALLERAALPTGVAGLPSSAEVARLMLDDKKTLGGRLRLVVPEGLGRAAVVEGVPTDAVERAIDAIRRP